MPRKPVDNPKRIRKPMTVAKAQQLEIYYFRLVMFSIIKEYGIKIKGFLISGLPGEDQSTVDETIHFIKTQPVDYFTVSTFTPFPGTEIWKSPERFNYVFNKQESFDNFLMLSKERITRAVSKNSDMVYHFHKQLLEASAERDTGIRSFNVARKRDKVQKWMEEF